MGSFTEWERDWFEADILRGAVAKVSVRSTAAYFGLDRRAWAKRVRQLQRKAERRKGKEGADLAVESGGAVIPVDRQIQREQASKYMASRA